MNLKRASRFVGLVSLLLVAVMVIAACGGDTGQEMGESPGTLPETGSSGITGTMPFTDTSPLTGTPSMTDTLPSPTDSMTNELTIELTAQDFLFDTNVITVTAGSRVIIKFTNMDSAPHNLAIYNDESLETPIYLGEIITGPNTTVTYEFLAPANPGAYFFQCDVHPEQMTGQFIVQ